LPTQPHTIRIITGPVDDRLNPRLSLCEKMLSGVRVCLLDGIEEVVEFSLPPSLLH
jgi:hypothetical protein